MSTRRRLRPTLAFLIFVLALTLAMPTMAFASQAASASARAAAANTARLPTTLIRLLPSC